MKHLILSALVSVICSVIAINWLAPVSANATGQHGATNTATGNHSGQAGNNGQRNNAGRNQSISSASESGAARGRNQRQDGDGVVRGQNRKGNGERLPLIAGFNPVDTESSLLDMTVKLALDAEQQASVRSILLTYRKSYMAHSKDVNNSKLLLVSLNPDEPGYENDKNKVREAVLQASAQLEDTLEAKQKIFEVLNATQVKIVKHL